MKSYNTPEEHRAFVDGAGEVIESILKHAADLWKVSRESIDLSILRDRLLEEQVKSLRHVIRAQQMEALK